PARNVILFIGDGMGDSEITAARNYAVGAAGRLAMDSLPMTGAYTTYSIQEGDPALPDYVTDSAASGTAWATGRKTSNGRISTTARSDQDLPTILEIAQQRGMRTGDITTAELTDATPAVLASHVANRSCQGPADMAACPQDRRSAGGPGSIAEQLLAHDVDVLMGGGAARFEEQPMDDGRLPIQDALARGYRVVGGEAGFGLAVAGQKLLGLFAVGNMAVEWSGDEAIPYPSNVSKPQRCREDHRPLGQPALAEMTAKAIELLDRPSGPGFFLQVEGASIDKEDHNANPCGQIGETIAFDRAIRIGIEFAHRHPDTLLVVTADHGHTSQIVSVPTDASHPAGVMSVLLTHDGAPMTMSYATNAYHHSMDHTGTEVRIAAMGPLAANVTGVIDQTDLFRVMLRAISTKEQLVRANSR
ncbi:MAG TPA: alkaline phosphatase, partial [Vicinamibacterales bacterium]|nr:alkaline phosphatase [Vicinamibacterales bacterium]